MLDRILRPDYDSGLGLVPTTVLVLHCTEHVYCSLHCIHVLSKCTVVYIVLSMCTVVYIVLSMCTVVYFDTACMLSLITDRGPSRGGVSVKA